MKYFTKENCWRWFLFLSKTYLFAMPTVLLICQLPGLPMAPNARDAYFEGSPVVESVFRRIGEGYIVCFVVLLVNVIFAISTRDKNKIRPALIFAILALISVVFFYLFAFWTCCSLW